MTHHLPPSLAQIAFDPMQCQFQKNPTIFYWNTDVLLCKTWTVVSIIKTGFQSKSTAKPQEGMV